MKYTAIFVLLLAFTQAEFIDNKMMQFLQLKEQASDAVDAVMDVLNGLKQSALDERAALEAQHDAEEAFFASRIADLTQIMNTNRGIYEDAVAHREYIEAEIVNTANYIDYIHMRFGQIETLIAELQDERCDASLLFVTRIREHYEAMEAITLLRSDLQDWEAAGMPHSFAEIKKLDSFSKLGALTKLFKKQALDEFLALGQDVTDGTRRRSEEEVGDDHVDNDQGALELENQVADADLHETLMDKLMSRLTDLELELEASLEALIAAEVRAGRDTVDFVQESEREVHVLQLELDVKTAYAAKLENDLVLAVDNEAKTLATWEMSVTTLENCKAELEAHRAFYMQEVERLRGDVETVDEVILIFKQELMGIDDIIRNQKFDVMGVVDDERFGSGMFGGVDQGANQNYDGQGGIAGAEFAAGGF